MMGYRVSLSLEIRGNSETFPPPSPLTLPLIDNVRLTPPESYPEQRLSRVNCAWAQPVLAHPPPYGVIATDAIGWTNRVRTGTRCVERTKCCVEDAVRLNIRSRDSRKMVFVVSFFFGCYNNRSNESVETTRLKLNYCGY